jgi:hypothetical protein
VETTDVVALDEDGSDDVAEDADHERHAGYGARKRQRPANPAPNDKGCDGPDGWGVAELRSWIWQILDPQVVGGAEEDAADDAGENGGPAVSGRPHR